MDEQVGRGEADRLDVSSGWEADILDASLKAIAKRNVGMTVGFKVGSITDEIGSSDFFHAFFSTVSARLEHSWGARFPALMTKFYQGELQQEDAAPALSELATIQSELRAFAPSQIVWDIDDKTKLPPWGTEIAPTITDLSNYFVTSTGRDLIETLREGIGALREQGGVGRVVKY